MVGVPSCPVQLGELVHFLLGADRLADLQPDELADDVLPQMSAEQKAVTAAAIARNVMYWKTLNAA